MALSTTTPPSISRYLQRVHDARSNPTRAAVLDVQNRSRYEDAGWGIIVSDSEPPSTVEALNELIKLRIERLEQRSEKKRFRFMSYRPGESCLEWITRNGGDGGTVNPDRIPYYLLVVGDPTWIPFDFTQDLNVLYCVGRLSFSQRDAYRKYAEAIVDHERRMPPINTATVTYVGTRHSGDRATQLSSNRLVLPLYESMCEWARSKEALVQRLILGPGATKEEVLTALSNDQDSPRLVFTATHGIEFPIEQRTLQRERQGALLCQDWRGVGSISECDYLAANDIPDTLKLTGTIICSFACYSAGTPTEDYFGSTPNENRPPLTDLPFSSALSQRALSAPGGPALAFIGHVGRAWSFSFLTLSAVPVQDAFRNLCSSILSRYPAGLALEAFSSKYGTHSVELERLRRNRRLGAAVSDRLLSEVWLARNDSGSYALLGDPAVRL